MIALLVLAATVSAVSAQHFAVDNNCTLSVISLALASKAEKALYFKQLLASGNLGDLGKPKECVLTDPSLHWCQASVNLSAVLGAPGLPAIPWGLCVPRHCKGAVLANGIVRTVQGLLPGRAVYPAAVPQVDCYPDELDESDVAGHYTVRGVAVLAVLGVLLLFGLLVTCAKQCQSGGDREATEARAEDDADDGELVALLAPERPRRPGGRRLVAAFDWSRAYAALVAPTPPTLRSADGVRTLAMWWIVLGHTFSFKSLLLGQTAPLTLRDSVRHNRWWYAVVATGLRSVDTFFFLSALIVCYVVTRRATSKRQPLTLKAYGVLVLKRYVRLTPLLVFFMLVWWWVMPMFVDSPAAAQAVRLVDSSFCADSWWENVLYISNVYPGYKKLCMGWEWYLNVDMQLFVVAMPLLCWTFAAMARRKRAHLHWAAVGVPLVAVSVALRVALTLADDLHYVQSTATDPFQTRVYTQSYTRMAPYIVGGVLGCWLGGGKSKRGSVAATMGRWVLHAAAVAGVVLTVVGTNYLVVAEVAGTAKAPRWAEVLYIGAAPTAWAVALAWLVHCGARGWLPAAVRTLLEAAPMGVLGKLGLSVYLLHPTVILGSLFDSEREPPFMWWSLVSEWIGTTVLCYAAAVVVYVAIEYPMREVFGVVFGGSKERKSTIN